MEEINLKNIFRYIVSDDTFLKEIINVDDEHIDKKKNSTKGFRIMSDLTRQYVPLAPAEVQGYKKLPKIIRFFVPDGTKRIGVKNITRNNMNPINISFLCSLNVILRPDLFVHTDFDHSMYISEYYQLRDYISNSILKNYHIDKVKNTKRVKQTNSQLADILNSGRMIHDLIDYIVNLFEINLLVIDVSKNISYFYWTHGTKFPYLNLFKPIHVMTYIDGNYEPIIPPDCGDDNMTHQHQLYAKILMNPDKIDFRGDVKIYPPSTLYVDTWDVPVLDKISIMERYVKFPDI